jgi:O-antigen/teichoic acid export membrane protein
LQNHKEVLEVKEKAIKGGGTLLLRQLGVHLINIVGNIVLARILIPEDFGIYAIVTFLINFLVLFGDVGLGASLIQRTQEPTNKEFRSIFTFQQIVNSVIVIFAFIISPLIVKHYHLKDDAVWMIRLMVLTLILVSFHTTQLKILKTCPRGNY